MLGRGSYGQVWEALQLQKDPIKEDSTQKSVAIKFFNNKEGFEKEKIILQNIANSGIDEGLVKILDDGQYGEINYIIMQKYGPSLEDLLLRTGKTFTLKTVLQIGIQMFNILKLLHSKPDNGEGYIHHDIKPDNILIKSAHFDQYESSLLTLIDFSVSTSIKIANQASSNKVILDIQSQQSLEEEFNGNLVFASLYQMMKQKPSRKDDIVSLLYMLLYLKDGDLPWTKNFRLMTLEQNFERILKHKELFHQEATDFTENSCIFRFLISTADQLRRTEVPEYNFYIQQLQNELKRSSFKLDWIFDWTVPDFNEPKSMLNNLDRFSQFQVNEKRIIITNLQGTTENLNNFFFASNMDVGNNLYNQSQSNLANQIRSNLIKNSRSSPNKSHIRNQQPQENSNMNLKAANNPNNALNFYPNFESCGVPGFNSFGFSGTSMSNMDLGNNQQIQQQQPGQSNLQINLFQHNLKDAELKSRKFGDLRIQSSDSGKYLDKFQATPPILSNAVPYNRAVLGRPQGQLGAGGSSSLIAKISGKKLNYLHGQQDLQKQSSRMIMGISQNIGMQIQEEIKEEDSVQSVSNPDIADNQNELEYVQNSSNVQNITDMEQSILRLRDNRIQEDLSDNEIIDAVKKDSKENQKLSRDSSSNGVKNQLGKNSSGNNSSNLHSNLNSNYHYMQGRSNLNINEESKVQLNSKYSINDSNLENLLNQRDSLQPNQFSRQISPPFLLQAVSNNSNNLNISQSKVNSNSNVNSGSNNEGSGSSGNKLQLNSENNKGSRSVIQRQSKDVFANDRKMQSRLSLSADESELRESEINEDSRNVNKRLIEHYEHLNRYYECHTNDLKTFNRFARGRH
eukprot:403377565